MKSLCRLRCWAHPFCSLGAWPDGFCSVIVQPPRSSNVRRSAFTSATDACVSPSHVGQASRGRIAGIRSVIREIWSFAGVVTCTKVSSVCSPLSHCSQITAIAIVSPSFGVMTHCFVCPLGSSSPLLNVCTMRMPRRLAKAFLNVGSLSIVSHRACMCFGREGNTSPLPTKPHRMEISSPWRLPRPMLGQQAAANTRAPPAMAQAA